MPKTLLLADDSITIQKVVGITFANEDFAVTSVGNGEDAISKAREIKPDVILADVVMPRKNGYELCEAVKADPSLRHIPVLLLAGTFEAFDEARARSVKADGHISKPFESGALINKVKELVLGKGAVAAAPGAAASAPRPAAARPPGAAPAAARPIGAPAAARPGGAPMPGRPGMPPPGAPRPPGQMAPGARPPGPGMPPGARPPGAPSARPPGPVPPGAPARPGGPMAAPRPGTIPPGARPPGPGMSPGAPRPGAAPAMARPPMGGTPAARPGTPPGPAARPAAPAPARPAPAAPPPATGGKRDPFGFGLGAPAAPATKSDDDWSDLGTPPKAPLPEGLAPTRGPGLDFSFDAEADKTSPIPEVRKPLDLPDGPETAPELAPMHAFVPPADKTGHQPAASNASADGGEAVLREALSKASRDVIERVVWEVVPQLAETIIRENLDRLVKERQG